MDVRLVLSRSFSLVDNFSPRWVAGVCSVFGLLGVFWLRGGLSESDLAAGPLSISLFIPFTACALYLFFLTVTGRIGPNLYTIATLAIFLLTALGFVGYLDEPLWHFYYDDPGRYSAYANFMVNQGTLWGNDAVSGVSANNAYFIDQPGYRYYLALMILVFGEETRLIQIVNLFVYLCSLLLLLSTFDRDSETHNKLICVFFVFSLPYAAHNILEGLSEWIALSLFYISVFAGKRDWKLFALICLAFMPIVRQNLIFLACCYAFMLCLIEPNRTKQALYAAFFLALTLLPLYHNLIFADEWRLLSSNKGNIISWNQSFSQIIQTLGEIMYRKLPQYIGYYETASTARTLVTVIFAPLGTGLVGYYFLCFRGYKKLLFFLTSLIVVVPTTLFGWGYFPRFVFSNLALILSSIPLILYFVKHRADRLLPTE